MDSSKQISLDGKQWAPFRIADLFNVVLSSGDIKLSKIEPGDVKLVSSGKTNNGLVGFIDSEGDGEAEIFNGNCLTVDMFGNAFYQPDSFYSVSHGRVNILQSNFDLTSNIGLFIATVIKKEQYKYDYGRGVYSSVISDMNVYLPIDGDGKPDWNWIESFMKSLPYSDKD